MSDIKIKLVKRPTYTMETHKIHSPWYNEEYPLSKFTFQDGTILFEGIQAEPWSSGPCSFMALYYDQECQNPVLATLWNQKIIDQT